MSKKKETLISNLDEMFASLRKCNMMLNPKKCFFGIPARKLLGFIVSERGIEVNRDKIKAILNITKPTRLKDVQRLTSCIAAVSRFVAGSVKEMHLYKNS